jgi:hypothetical protein
MPIEGEGLLSTRFTVLSSDVDLLGQGPDCAVTCLAAVGRGIGTPARQSPTALVTARADMKTPPAGGVLAVGIGAGGAGP